MFRHNQLHSLITHLEVLRVHAFLGELTPQNWACYPCAKVKTPAIARSLSEVRIAAQNLRDDRQSLDGCAFGVFAWLAQSERMPHQV
jgi:hypothetical protein